MRPRIFLAEDTILLLEKVRTLVTTVGRVIGTAHDGLTAVEYALRLQPDLVIMDISMPLLNGLDAARQIKARLSDCKVIFLTVHDNGPYIEEAFELGADGYVLKKSIGADLLPAIRAVLAGERAFPDTAPSAKQEGGRRLMTRSVKS